MRLNRFQNVSYQLKKYVSRAVVEGVNTGQCFRAACVVKIMQLLQAHEHAAGFFADAILVFVEKFGLRNMVGDIIR